MNRHGGSIDRPTGQRVDGISKRVLDGGMAGVKSFGNMTGVDGWNDKVRRERTVAVHAEN